MKTSKSFFSGFCFKDEKELFTEYLIENDFTISGFSYGAIKAYEETFEKVVEKKERVDKLQLFSPAFFQSKDAKFKKLQLMFFKKDEDEYIKNFVENVKYSSSKDGSKDIEKYLEKGTYKELEELLNYVWSEEKLQELVEKGVKIEVFLGSEDLIIDSPKAKDFFKNYATVYYFKEKGHLL